MLPFLITCVILSLLISYICFRIIFYAPPRNHISSDEIRLPKGKPYEVFWDDMRRWTLETRNMPCQEVSIISYDGLTLYGKYYEYASGAPIELMFHGYRGDAERDLSGGVQRCFQLGHSALIVDQRGAGKSQGRVITFGIREHRDCLSWVHFMLNYFGADVQIILTGISMGAATVLMAAGKPLPDNVIGVLADCGFTSAKDIIFFVARQMHLPIKLLYPFVKLGARLYGGFRLEEYSPLEAMRSCELPVIFFHGEADDYVPSFMSRRNFDACHSRKRLVEIPNAVHGLSYPVDPETYIQEAYSFFHGSCME